MNLSIQHLNVKIDPVFASLIAQKLHTLEEKWGVTSASVIVTRPESAPRTLCLRAALVTGLDPVAAECVDRSPKAALGKLMRRLQNEVRRKRQSLRPVSAEVPGQDQDAISEMAQEPLSRFRSVRLSRKSSRRAG